MALLNGRAAPIVSFLSGAVIAAALTAVAVAPKAGDLVRVDERRGTVGVVSADGGAFVVDGAGSYHVFTTEGLENLRPGARVVVGLVHVGGGTDVPLYIRPQG